MKETLAASAGLEGGTKPAKTRVALINNPPNQRMRRNGSPLRRSFFKPRPRIRHKQGRARGLLLAAALVLTSCGGSQWSDPVGSLERAMGVVHMEEERGGAYIYGAVAGDEPNAVLTARNILNDGGRDRKSTRLNSSH